MIVPPQCKEHFVPIEISNIKLVVRDGYVILQRQQKFKKLQKFYGSEYLWQATNVYHCTYCEMKNQEVHAVSRILWELALSWFWGFFAEKFIDIKIKGTEIPKKIHILLVLNIASGIIFLICFRFKLSHRNW